MKESGEAAFAEQFMFEFYAEQYLSNIRQAEVDVELRQRP